MKHAWLGQHVKYKARSRQTCLHVHGCCNESGRHSRRASLLQSAMQSLNWDESPQYLLHTSALDLVAWQDSSGSVHQQTALGQKLSPAKVSTWFTGTQAMSDAAAAPQGAPAVLASVSLQRLGGRWGAAVAAPESRQRQQARGPVQVTCEVRESSASVPGPCNAAGPSSDSTSAGLKWDAPEIGRNLGSVARFAALTASSAALLLVIETF